MCVDAQERKTKGQSSLSLWFGHAFGSDETLASAPAPINVYELCI